MAYSHAHSQQRLTGGARGKVLLVKGSHGIQAGMAPLHAGRQRREAV